VVYSLYVWYLSFVINFKNPTICRIWAAIYANIFIYSIPA